MKLEPQSENGKILVTVQADWIEKSPELVVDELKRMFLMCSLKLKNEDTFITVLYAQKVLDESPSVLSQRFPSSLLRVQRAIEVCLDKRCAKELVVALELSKNPSILTDALNWTEKNKDDIQEKIHRASSVDLAPEKAQKSKRLSEIISVSGVTSGVVVKPRYREIRWTNEEKYKYCTTVELCNDKVVVGYNDGQIKIYNCVSLNCETVLNYGNSEANVSCLQCTCKEIISGYSDGSIDVWDIQAGVRREKLSLVNGSDDSTLATCLRWRVPNLVAGTNKGRIHVWLYTGPLFTPLGSFHARSRAIQDVHLSGGYVILRSHGYYSQTFVNVHRLDGQQIRSISSDGGILQMAVHWTHLITCNTHGTLKIWNFPSGDCLQEMKSHGICMLGFDANLGTIASGTSRGVYHVWNVKAAMKDSQADLTSFLHGSDVKLWPRGPKVAPEDPGNGPQGI